MSLCQVFSNIGFSLLPSFDNHFMKRFTSLTLITTSPECEESHTFASFVSRNLSFKNHEVFQAIQG